MCAFVCECVVFVVRACVREACMRRACVREADECLFMPMS